MPDRKIIEKIPTRPESNFETGVNIENQPEKTPEQKPEQEVNPSSQEQETASLQEVAVPSQIQSSDNLVADSDFELKKVENILSQDIEQVFLSMDSVHQQEFRRKGEQTAKEIAGLMKKTKVKMQQVIELIADWLRIIPKVNKHFVEQEAKIKADAILKAYQKNK